MPACGGSDASPTDRASDASAPAPSVAHQTNDGELYAAVNDARRKWFVTHREQDGEWQSGSFWRSGPMNSAIVTISGLTDEDVMPTGKGDLRISMTVANLASAPDAQAVQFVYQPDGYSKAWLSEDGGEANVTLYEAQMDGEFLKLGGSFSGVVLLPDRGNVSTDTDMARSFEIKDGSFSVRIRQQQ
ncbi:MAG: hypothetical protein RLN72_12060 [Henriciella sp.]